MMPGPASTSKQLARGPWIALSSAMRRFLLLLALLVPALAADPFTARVVRVIDGDTIAVEAPGHIFKVRLFGIDCPEHNQDGGPEATWFTTEMAMDRSVTVIEHDMDRYGRIVADIVLPDGRVLNKELVRSGNAWWYWKYDRADAELEALEEHAREAHLGLGAASNPLPPWEWRKAGHAAAPHRSSRRSRPRSEPRSQQR
jgi:micrococcal nuclease